VLFFTPADRSSTVHDHMRFVLSVSPSYLRMLAQNNDNTSLLGDLQSQGGGKIVGGGGHAYLKNKAHLQPRGGGVYRRTSISRTIFSGKDCLSGTIFHAM
jgi:hypothetical protein